LSLLFSNRLSYDNTHDDLERHEDELLEIKLDAGELIWAVAFGSDVPHTMPDSTGLNWSSQRVHRHLFAVGLQSGGIKIWEVRTGI